MNKAKLTTLFRHPAWTTFMLVLYTICLSYWIGKSYSGHPHFIECVPIGIPIVLTSAFASLILIGLIYIKVYQLDKLIIKGFLANTLSGGFLSVFFLVFFLLLITITGTIILNFFTTDIVAWYGLITSIIALPILVLIYPSLNPTIKYLLKDREVLVSAISLPYRDNPSMETYASENNGFCYPFKSCPNIREIWVVVSQECIDIVKKIYPQVNDNESAMIQYIRNILSERNIKSDNITFHISEAMDFNDIDNCYSKLERMFKIIGKEKSPLTIVNISPGTKIVGSTLAMFAIQGNRMLSYNKQLPRDSAPKDPIKVFHETNPFVESTANVISMKELLEEMAIELQSAR